MNSLSSKRAVLCFAVCAVAVFFWACASGGVNVPDDLSPAEIIQRAQEASDRNRYNTALQYYQILLERNRSNIDLICTAEYEIAFIHYKQKKYALAREELVSLLDYYDNPNQSLLPPQFKILARIVLGRIDEKDRSKNK